MASSTAGQIELVLSAHGLPEAGRFRLRLGVFVQSSSLNSIMEVTRAEGRAIGKLLVPFLFCWIYDGSAWAACNAMPPQCISPDKPYLRSQVLMRNGAMGRERKWYWPYALDLVISWLWCLLCASQAFTPRQLRILAYQCRTFLTRRFLLLQH